MFDKNSSAENKKDKYNQLNERYEKVKNVKYSNDTSKIDFTINTLLKIGYLKEL